MSDRKPVKKRGASSRKEVRKVETMSSAGMNFPVAAVGASAGALDAFRQLLSSLPVNSGIAFILIPHLYPQHESMMTELLSGHTRMPVRQISDGMEVRPNQIHVIPSNQGLEIRQGRLYLTPPAMKRGVRMPIDAFFHSLAADCGSRSIAIVLSGTDADGTEGLQAIEEAGGMILIQDPRTAAFTGMPCNAEATGFADFVLPVPEMGPVLTAYARQKSVSLLDKDSVELRSLMNILRGRTGHDFRNYKKPTLLRRIQRRMNLNRIENFDDYVNCLKQKPEEVRQLFNDLLIGVTSFFRDADAFKTLEKDIIPTLVRDNSPYEPVRVWVPGCSTGEEAYSIAILLRDEFTRQNKDFNAQIFATDIDEMAIARARQGRYLLHIAEHIPAERLQSYFIQENGFYCIKKELRETVVFAVQNLISDPPFSRLNLICCRNVLIYLEAGLQDRLISVFNFALSQGGYLFVGSSESLSRHRDIFQPVSNLDRIYRKIAEVSSDRSALQMLIDERSARPLNAPDLAKGRIASGLADAVNNILLRTFAPAAVLINHRHEALYFQGPVGRYLDYPSGEPTNDLLSLVLEEIRPKLRFLIQKSMQSKIVESAIVNRVKRHDDRFQVKISVRPLQVMAESGLLWLVCFEEELKEGLGELSVPEIAEKEGIVTAQLEHELRIVRMDLQSTIEQLEASNEELKASHEEAISMNEELQSTNEELETSREELQSLNEELSTVNNQLKEKVYELEAANNDLHNLLISTDIATLFLDTSFHIRRFTPATKNLFNLIQSDIGRPLNDIAMKIRDEALLGDCGQVLKTLVPVEREVESGKQAFCLRRVTPYRTRENKIEGVVVTYTNISQIKLAEQRLAARERQQAIVAKIGQKALSGEPLHSLFAKVAKWVADVFLIEYCKILELIEGENRFLLRAGVGWREGLVGEEHVPAGMDSQAGYTLASRIPVIVEDLTREKRFSGPALLLDHEIRSGMSVLIGPVQRPYGVLGVHSREKAVFTVDDANFLQAVANVIWEAVERNRREEQLRNNETRLRLALELGHIVSWEWDLKSNNMYWDIGFYRMLGLAQTKERTTMETFFGRVHPDDIGTVRQTLAEVIHRQSEYNSEFRILRADNGESRWLAAKGGLVLDRDGKPSSMFGVCYDITEGKKLHETLEAARHAAERASHAKSEFLANMSHEIRSPLTAVLGFSDLVLAETKSEKIADFALKIKQNGQYLLEIVNDVLDLSKVEANKFSLRKERFSPQQLLMDLCSIMHMRALEKGIHLKLHIRGLIPETIEGDPTRLRQILINLIGNAVKFTVQGEVSIDMRLQVGDDESSVLYFDIRDTGIGIAEEDMERMFEPFEQAKNTPSRSYAGTGLGLAISKRLAEIMGGDIQVSSMLGRGSTFTLRIPAGSLRNIKQIKAPSDILLKQPIKRFKHYQLNARVLIVDDIQDVRLLLEQILCRAGARVKAVENAEECLEYVAQAEKSGDAFDLILMDIMLPGMNGYEATRLLRQRGYKNPIIAITAVTEEGHRKHCLQAGCNDCLPKPIDGDRLLAMIQDYTQTVKTAATPETAGRRHNNRKVIKVLIVDDNRDAGEALCELLNLAGYATRFVMDGAAAIQVAPEFLPNVVLLDLGLPDQDGTEVLQELKRIKSLKKTFFVALSGRIQPEEGGKMLAHGFDNYMIKPVSFGDLKTLLPSVEE